METVVKKNRKEETHQQENKIKAMKQMEAEPKIVYNTKVRKHKK